MASKWISVRDMSACLLSLTWYQVLLPAQPRSGSFGREIRDLWLTASHPARWVSWVPPAEADRLQRDGPQAAILRAPGDNRVADPGRKALWVVMRDAEPH